MNALFLLSLAVSFALSAPDATVTGYGCSVDPKQATEYALEDIASQIATRVESTLLTTRQVSENVDTAYSYRRLKVSTDMVILGAKTRADKGCVTAALKASSAPLYTEALRKLKEEIDAAWIAAGKAESDSLKKRYLGNALTAWANYERYAVPARWLKAEIPQPVCTETEVNLQLERLADISADPARIARNIMSQITVPVEVLPPELFGSYGVTAFSSLLKSEMDALNKPGKAQQKLRCTYSPDLEKSYFILGCTLTGSHNTVEKSILTNVSMKVCEAVDCALPPQIQRMEALFPGSGGLGGHFYTDYEEGALILSEGDVITLYARMNSPSDLLLMALSPDGQRLYAVPMPGGIVKKLNKQAVGRSIELARLTVTPPYGTESLTLFAYTGKLEAELPKYTTDNKSGLYVFKDSPETVLNKLRSLPQENFFEKKLIFTTIKRLQK